MPFTYRDKPKLSERLRGKSGEEILNEMKGDFDKERRMFFDSPWRAGHNNSGFPRGFPFDDYPNRPNVRSYWANRYPEFAEDLKEPWSEDFRNQFFTDRTSDCTKNQAAKEPDCGSTSGEGRHSPKLNQFGLRNTVPLGQNANPEEQRRQRSMSAPPDSRGTDKPKRFISKCEIPMMHDPEEQAMPTHDPRPGNSTNVRIIPIQVEGRDKPIVNDDSHWAGSDGLDFGMPVNFGSLEKNSPRFIHKERGPPQQQYQPHQQFQQHRQQQPPPHQQFQQQRQQQPPPHQQFQQQRQQQPPSQPQPKAQAPPEPMPMPMPMPPPPPQQQQQQQQPQHPPQTDEVDSKPMEAPKQPEPPKDPLTKVSLIQKEVDELKQQVEAFNGKSRTDKQFMMLDEMLTRKLISLDDINTEGKEDVRQARKDTIRSIQRCISMLESRVPPVENKEVSDSNTDESTALVPAQTMEMDTDKEPNGEAESRKNESTSGEVV